MNGLVEIYKENISPKAYYSLKEDSGVILYFPREQEASEDGSELKGIKLALEYALYNFNIDYAQIICFGNNLYDKEVIKIANKHPNIQIDLVVCSPNAEIIKEDERKILQEKIVEAQKKENIKIKESQTPPTLRSCILYEKKNPVLCCVQNYVLMIDMQRKPSFTGRDTPCVIAYKYNKKKRFPFTAPPS